jgi:hypothetical protein
LMFYHGEKSTLKEAAYFITLIGIWRMNSTPENEFWCLHGEYEKHTKREITID